MKIISKKEHQRLIDIESKYRELIGERITFYDKEDYRPYKKGYMLLQQRIDDAILIIKGIAYGGNEDYYIDKLKELLEILKGDKE